MRTFYIILNILNFDLILKSYIRKFFILKIKQKYHIHDCELFTILLYKVIY